MTGFEPWIISGVSGVAVPIFQSLWGSGGKVLGIFGKTLDENTKQLIFDASQLPSNMDRTMRKDTVFSKFWECVNLSSWNLCIQQYSF